MKKWIPAAAVLLILLLLILWFFIGTPPGRYELHQPADEIDRIELVAAENSQQFTVLKTLPDTERADFLTQFLQLPFDTYYIGDPMSVEGDAIRIVYGNGDYEMICHHWAEYVTDGSAYFVRKNCVNEDFYNLWNRFLD